MRILTLSNCSLDPCTGSGKTVLAYSAGLRALGHHVDVLGPDDYEPCQSLGKAKQWRQAAGAAWAVGKRLKSSDYDIVEFYGAEFWLATALRDAPTAHRTTWIRRWRDSAHDRLCYRAFTDADAFVSLCSAELRHVLSLGLYDTARAAVVEPGLDPEYLDVPLSAHRDNAIAFTGSWMERKGIAALCTAVTALLKQRPDLRFDVYGTGGARGAVLSCFAPELHHQIVIHPRLPSREMAAGLARASVFLFPSRYEGFGIALAEAMACGCAPVTTPVGFAADLQDGQEALLCVPDDPAGLQRLTARLLDNTDLRCRIANNASTRARRFKWDENVRKLGDLYARWSADHLASLPR